MELPCTTCKYKTERRQGHRTFVGCNDEDKKKGFIEDTFTYRHECSNYERGEENDK